MRALARAELRIPTDGVVGVRVNHNLDLLITDLRVDRAPARIR